ncbi:hypothetical protein NT6N_07390 [Oceaniferula spumae]|uniref:DUF5069 domain-containing protein n=1 Tax=Oceaniferula spumae TaxID=2979115 RepID=A0AAT9FI89_9BACT
MSSYQAPRSPRDEIDGMLYFPRLCDKIRIHSEGKLDKDYIENLGGGMDLWTCQFLGVDYNELRVKVLSGLSDEAALTWAKENGTPRDENELAWWNQYMQTRGFRDDMADRLAFRKEEANWGDRDDIVTFFDFIDVDENRIE